ncbi:MAG: IS1380 family transposase [Spirochaetia bacterium]
MQTDCSPDLFGFQDLGARKVVAGFDGGMISSDAGGLLLREVAVATDLLRQFSTCFLDYRNQRFIEHSVQELVSQRVMGLCLGYEDVVDHDMLRFDSLFATLCGKEDLSGEHRVHARDKGKGCAGKSTLNRLEAGEDFWHTDAVKKIVANTPEIEKFFVKAFLNNHPGRPKRIVLDLDVTDNELHGKQEGRFFHGHYDCYCYLPLYIYCGDDLLCAKLRSAEVDPAEGVTEELDRIVGLIRNRWKHVEIVLRGDSGFCREQLLRWCEDHGLLYVIGLQRNTRLVERIRKHLRRSCAEHARTSLPARRYLSFYYRTRRSWSRSRRVIAKAEYTEGKENSRFVVTNLPREPRYSAQKVYEEQYCPRGEMENRIKEQQLYLFADRSSCMKMAANQVRLWFSAVSYVLMNELRRRTLRGTELAEATCQTIRLKLFKIGGLVRVSVRRVAVSLSTGYPYRELFLAAYRALRSPAPLRC